MRVYPDKTQDQEFNTLGDQGFSGSLNDRQYGYLGSLGYTGALPDRFHRFKKSFLADLYDSGASFLYLGGFNPSQTKMFEQSDKTGEVTEAGQPVGFVMGSGPLLEAVQPTALSRPVLGRWPMGEKVRNLLIHTEDLTSTYWHKNRLGPIGVSDGAVEVREPDDALTTDRYFQQAISGFVAGDKVTWSVEVKSVGGRYIWMRNTGSSGPLPGMIVSPTGGLHIPPATADAYGVEAVDDGFWRIWMTWTIASGGTFVPRLQLRTATSQVTLGDPSCGMIIRRHQVERGTVRTPYQATDADGVPLAGYGAVRNLANGAQELENPTYWPVSNIAGVTRSHVGYGFEDGVPYVDINIAGTLTYPEIPLYAQWQSAQLISNGDVYTVRSHISVLSGDMSSPVVGFRANILERTGIEQGFVRGTIGNTIANAGESTSTHTCVGGDSDYVHANIVFRAATGAAIDITVRIKGLQFERGDTETPLQLNYGPNNVTEQGVEDVWFLVNDGNDSLLSTVPAGPYEIAYLSPSGLPQYVSQTLPSAGTLNVLRAGRLVDVVVKQGSFTSDEKRKLEQEWERYVL